jgi:hypothetical protein
MQNTDFSLSWRKSVASAYARARCAGWWAGPASGQEAS